MASQTQGRQQRRPRRPVRLEGQRRCHADRATSNPQPDAGHPDGRFVERNERQASSTTHADVERRWSISASTACSISSRSSSASRPRCGATSGRDGQEPRPMGHWLAVGLEQEATIATPSAPGRGQEQGPHPALEVTIGGGHGVASLVRTTSAWARRRRCRYGCSRRTAAGPVAAGLGRCAGTDPT